MFMMFTLGVILFTMSVFINSKCVNVDIQNLVSTLFVLSTTLIVSTICFMACMMFTKCASCSTTDSNVLNSGTMKLYLVFTACLGITLITVGSMLTSKSHSCEQNVKKTMNGVWVIGILTLLPSLVYTGMSIYKHQKSGL
jgi:hypothetical protein